MALTDYDREHLSASQQAAVEKATADWNAANARGDTAGMQAAHAAAEAARNSSGYSSDSWGSYSGSYSGGSSGGGGSYSDGGSSYASSPTYSASSVYGGSGGSGASGTRYNPPTEETWSGGTPYSSKMPSMARNEALAGKTVYSHGMNVTYDKNGYAVSAVNPGHSLYKGTERAYLAPSYEAVLAGVTGADRSQYGGSDYDKQYFTTAQLQRADQLRAQAAAGEISWKDAHDYAESVRNSYGYSGGADGSQFNQISPLHAWNDGWGGNFGNGMTYAEAYQRGLLANGPGSEDEDAARIYAMAQSVQGGMSAPGAYGLTGNSGLADQLASLYAGSGPYAQALAELQAANRAATQSAIQQLERQRQNVNDEYSDLYRQAYIDKMNAMKDMNQRLAAQGVTGGAAESTMLGLNTAYQNALRQGEQSRIGTIGDLDQAIVDAQLAGDMKNAQAAMESAQDQTSRYASILQTLLNREDTLNAQAAEQARSEQNSSQSWARQMALQMLDAGNMPDDATLSAAGITRAQALNLLTQTDSSTYTPGFTRAQVMDAYNRAVKAGTSLSGNLLRDYNYYLYGDPDYTGVATSIQSSAAPAAKTGGVSYNNGGYTNKQIHDLQAWLQTQGINIDADGYWGPASKKAMGGKTAAEAMDLMTEFLAQRGGGTTASAGKISSSEALKRAASAASTQSGQLSYLKSLKDQGLIDDTQLNDLAYAIVNPGK